jgi:ABC-2 type transport system ATP-binding protein
MANVIETYDLTKTFGSTLAVDSLNLSVSKGTILGFVGANGAGKTTTIRMLLGLAKPTHGKAIVLGDDITTKRDYLYRTGFLPDVPSFYNWMNARVYLQFAGELFGIPLKKLKLKIDEVLDIVGLKGEKKRIGAFSRGMKQRLGIAQALINEPEVIFLDEPTSALDPVGRHEVLDIIASLRGKTTVFFSTHILPDVERIADEVAILHHGKLLIHKKLTELKDIDVIGKFELCVEGDSLKMFERMKELTSISDLIIENNKVTGSIIDRQKAAFDITAIASDAGCGITRMVVSEPSLEDVFLKIITRENNA